MAYLLPSYTTSTKPFSSLTPVSLGFSAPVSTLHHAVHEMIRSGNKENASGM